MNWQDYQKAVSAFFQSIGATTSIEAPLKGVRGTHNVDVLVRLKHFGIEVLWIVECKLWKTSVPKEKVLTLQQIVQDVGADRGFLMSESGFQAGTIKSASSSNITLSSLSELHEMAGEELMKLRLISVSVRLENLTRRYHTFIPWDKFSKLKPYQLVLESLPNLFTIRTELFKVYSDQFLVRLMTGTVKNIEEFIAASENIFTKAETEIKVIENTYNNDLSGGLKLFNQLKELTDRLISSASDIALAHDDPTKKDIIRLAAVKVMKKIGDVTIKLRAYTSNQSFPHFDRINGILIDHLYLDLVNEGLNASDVAKTSGNLQQAYSTFEKVFQPIIIPPVPNIPFPPPKKSDM
jgi:hypothetical protein